VTDHPCQLAAKTFTKLSLGYGSGSPRMLCSCLVQLERDPGAEPPERANVCCNFSPSSAADYVQELAFVVCAFLESAPKQYARVRRAVQANASLQHQLVRLLWAGLKAVLAAGVEVRDTSAVSLTTLVSALFGTCLADVARQQLGQSEAMRAAALRLTVRLVQQ